MTEDEYILVSNLAKIRVAESALRGMLPAEETEEKLFRDLCRVTGKTRELLEKKLEGKVVV